MFKRILFVTIFFFTFVSIANGQSVTLYRDLKVGDSGPDVKSLQVFLNTLPSTRIATFGAGSPGLETEYFGEATKAAVIKFQLANNISPAVGYVGVLTRAKIQSSTNISTSIPAQSQAAATGVKITSLSHTKAEAGTKVTISGEGFAKTGNKVLLGYKTITNLKSSDGKTLTFSLPAFPKPKRLESSAYVTPSTTFEIPDTLPEVVLPVWIFVENEKGLSNYKEFGVIYEYQ